MEARCEKSIFTLVGHDHVRAGMLHTFGHPFTSPAGRLAGMLVEVMATLSELQPVEANGSTKVDSHIGNVVGDRGWVHAW